MPTHKSADKRQRQNKVKNAANRENRSTIRTAVKGSLELATKGDKAAAKSAAKEATKMLDKAASKGLLKKGNARRRISRLNSRIAKLESTASSK